MVTVIALSLITSPMWIDVARRLHDLVGRGVSNRDELIEGLYPDKTSALREAVSRMLRRYREFRKPKNPPGNAP